ncbi:helix-turn-helix domain containing protein [Vagococcus luciliae]|uniref:Type III secretion system protein PrgN n=1 Tax=Vagococcus luciliae TaxID=2920380 RepID=A0ABY5P088_9ENTE|nr:helix-turn-helix domain containing protein [Vagococcus luciliae]UUV99334.1 hypothetical protein G314FT_14950 [Vagococcus luciliae]
MTTNTFVYPHPINTFIIKHLNYTVQEFCEQFQYPQSTVATWVSRERRIESLPVSFIYSLSLATSKSMDWVYGELLKLQDEYDDHKERFKRTKKHI